MHRRVSRLSVTGAKKMMGSVDQFLTTLQQFDKDNFIADNKLEVRKYTGPADKPNGDFTYDMMKSKVRIHAKLRTLSTLSTAVNRSHVPPSHRPVVRGGGAVRLGGQHLHLPRPAS